MAYTAGFSVSVGDPTKASDVSTLAANDDYLKAAVDGKAALSGSTNNTVATVTGANALIGEADLTFAANKLTVFGTTGTGAATASVLNLSTRETTVVDADQLGRIEFQAPAETGSDAVLVTASIYAEADGTFSATVNATDLVLATAHDGAAAERVRITSQGEIGLAGANYGSDGQVLTSAGAGAAAAWESVAAGITLVGSTNNTITTVTGANAMIGEANLTFDGSTLTVAGDQHITNGNGLIMGHTARVQVGWTTGENQILGTDDADANLSITRYSNDNGPPNLFLGKSRGSLGAQAIVADGDPLGRISFAGSDGVDMRSVGAWIEAECDGEFEADNVSGRLVFATTPDSAGVQDPIERMRIDSAGRVDIGTAGATVSSSADGLVVNDGANAGMTIYSTGTSSGQMKLSLTNAEGADAGAAMVYNNSADALFFNVNGATERMRISSTGNVNIGTAHTGAGMFEVNNDTNSGWISGKATHGDVTGNSLQMWFVSSTAADGDVPLQFNAAYGSGGTQVGAIDCTVDDITGGTIDSHWNHRSYQNNSARIATLSSAGVWTDYSAGADKEFLGTRQEVWPSGILPAICGLNVSKYQPANQPEGKPVREYHISPTAEDLYDAFGVGEDPHTKKLNKDGENITHPGIAPKDLAGIALVGLQELCGLVEAQAARITALESA